MMKRTTGDLPLRLIESNVELQALTERKPLSRATEVDPLFAAEDVANCLNVSTDHSHERWNSFLSTQWHRAVHDSAHLSAISAPTVLRFPGKHREVGPCTFGISLPGGQSQDLIEQAPS